MTASPALAWILWQPPPCNCSRSPKDVDLNDTHYYKDGFDEKRLDVSFGCFFFKIMFLWEAIFLQEKLSYKLLGSFSLYCLKSLKFFLVGSTSRKLFSQGGPHKTRRYWQNLCARGSHTDRSEAAGNSKSSTSRTRFQPRLPTLIPQMSVLRHFSRHWVVKRSKFKYRVYLNCFRSRIIAT